MTVNESWLQPDSAALLSGDSHVIKQGTAYMTAARSEGTGAASCLPTFEGVCILLQATTKLEPSQSHMGNAAVSFLSLQQGKTRD